MASRTPLYAQIKVSLKSAWLEERKQNPNLPNRSRRRFLKRSAAFSALSLTAPLLNACGGSNSSPGRLGQPKIAIIGAGLAGLSCAYALSKEGLSADIYEASSRAGGRTFSARGAFADGQLCELGGEFVDTGHSNLRALVAELGLTLVDVKAAYPNIVEDTYFVDGRALDEREIVSAFRPLAARMAGLVAASDESDEVFEQLDNTSIRAWLAAQSDISADLRALLDVAYLEEYGLETDRQSLFNLLYLIDYDSPDPFLIFGVSDERYHIAEGSDAVALKLAEMFGENIKFKHELLSASVAGDGAFQLAFSGPENGLRVRYERVVFALPFTLLREVDISRLQLPELKQQIIKELGYGTNSKLMLGFSARAWRDKFASSGSMIGNNGLQTIWDTSRGQSGRSGILTNFVGGSRGLEVAERDPQQLAAEVLPLIDQLWPGTSADYSGKALRMGWPSHPFTRGSYACYLPGQAQWSGLEGERVGNLHFCGEHTSVESQGYMEGACETGLRAASEIIADLASTAETPAETIRVALEGRGA